MFKKYKKQEKTKNMSMINENSWNLPHKMSPKIRKFSADSHEFKKEPKDIEKCH